MWRGPDNTRSVAPRAVCLPVLARHKPAPPRTEVRSVPILPPTDSHSLIKNRQVIFRSRKVAEMERVRRGGAGPELTFKIVKV